VTYVIVIIDDLRVPVTFEGGDMRVYRTATEGLTALKQIYKSGGHVDELWLDHDLGFDPETGEEWTIMPVVNWLEEQAHIGHPLDVRYIFVHTSNGYRGGMMVTALEKWYPHVMRDNLPVVNER
jgi:hypothetical protein